MLAVVFHNFPGYMNECADKVRSSLRSDCSKIEILQAANHFFDFFVAIGDVVYALMPENMLPLLASKSNGGATSAGAASGVKV